MPGTAMGWEIYAQGLADLISWLRYEYVIPAILITENGAAFEDCIEASGRISDVRRLQYLREHIEAIGRSIQQSDLAPVQGYFAWSLLDNFEWAEGYSKRFGLVYIDYDTQTRIIKIVASGMHPFWHCTMPNIMNRQQHVL
ncbi:family 1 glycosylhydrolase [Dictyobacter aurantiacus]|uniref:beta-glucosidase n=1 Tax=Dictyobacter aurantiacus TaxID=1936993 RepID=A0A401ZNE5_9CHLR|nr:family 1 glycosylhydrolase [Dictyobacter aurantiacus]GCE08385.1 hypothetical protein KDAU_57140 [Dictyobacter aurantiacus]